MTLLVIGLVLFLGMHAVTMARGLRADIVGRLGDGGYKALYSVVSFVGFGLIIWGYITYRQSGYIPVWSPPRAMTHIAMALMLPAMVLLLVYVLPGGRIKSAVQHPMLTMIKVWALAHLLVNGDLGSILLFGSFLAYAVINRISLKRRGRTLDTRLAWNRNDWAAIGLGLVSYFAVVYWLHPFIAGVPVLPRLA